MKKIVLLFTAALLLMVMPVFAGGGKQGSSTSGAALNLVPLIPDGVNILPIQAAGPNGEPVVGVETLLAALSPDLIKQVQGGKFTAAIAMHYTSNDWCQGIINGIKAGCAEFNIRVLSVTDAKMNVGQQVADVESLIQLKPSVIFGKPVDDIATAEVYKKAANAGITLVFIDSVPANLRFGADYFGLVQADNYVIAQAAAEILAEKIGGQGKVGLINNKNSMSHTDMRTRAARETFAKYPRITIAAQNTVGSDEEGAPVAESMLIGNPDIQAIWACWDGPGMAAAAALANLGKKVYIASPDLGTDAAYSIANEDLFIGSGAQHPYDQGVAASIIAASKLIGKNTYPVVIVPGEKVTKSNLRTAWEHIFHNTMPRQISDALNK